jgi:hypothetical protein
VFPSLVPGEMLHRPRLAAVALAVAALALWVGPVLADPINGNNSTPGSISCPSAGIVDARTTSGSGAAMAIQLVGTSTVFVVHAVPAFGITRALGNPNDIQCWVTEVSLGGRIEVWGQLTGR